MFPHETGIDLLYLLIGIDFMEDLLQNNVSTKM